MEFTHKVTVFTPTYNRAYILENLYRSLQRQTCMEFEWLIVDDGSSDGTEVLVDGWQRESNPFPIRYTKKDNGGKCRAINLGLQMAKGELFFTVDSDDYLTDDAIEKVIRWEGELPRDGSFCGFAGNLGTSPTETPNTPLPGGQYDGNAFDRYGAADGERASIFYTQIHRKYLYPEFPGETFIIESVPWNRMAHDGYKMRFFDDIIWVYAYQEDGLTNQGYRLFLDNPQGAGLFFREKARFLHAPPHKIFLMWYGFIGDEMNRCTDSQLSQYIGCPAWLVPPIKWLHSLHLKKHICQFFGKKR